MNNIKTVFTIRDLENISGVKAHTIRIWEKRYGLLEPKRTETNIRYYPAKSLLKLLNVVLLNKHNFKISKIAMMSEEQINLTARELSFKMAASDEAINAFKVSMFQFDKVLFNNTYNKLLHRKTFREIFKDTFMPFLEHIGLMWQTDTLMPAHEHFISNLIIQKIQINTEKLEYTVTDSSVTYVLFLPDGEIHEIGLLYLNYELALRGYQTIYLGQSLPLDNLSYFFDSDSDIVFISSMTVKPYEEDIVEYFQNIDAELCDTGHRFIGIGCKTSLIDTTKFNADIKVYPSVIKFLEEFTLI